MNVGDKIKMDGETQRYTVQAFDDRYVIMTKPFNARKTYLYTIADMETYQRGPIGLVFGLPEHVNTPEGASLVLKMMRDEGWQVSRRKGIPITADEEAQLLKASKPIQ
jgi:hypothetical protein